MLYVKDAKNIYALEDETLFFFFALFYYLYHYSIVNPSLSKQKTIFYTKTTGRISKKIYDIVKQYFWKDFFFCVCI